MEGESKINRRGFGSMDKARQSTIASRGGVAAHKAGTAHEFNSDEARAAGRKGGFGIVAARGKAYMSELGKRGAAARLAKKAALDAALTGAPVLSI